MRNTCHPLANCSRSGPHSTPIPALGFFSDGRERGKEFPVFWHTCRCLYVCVCGAIASDVSRRVAERRSVTETPMQKQGALTAELLGNWSAMRKHILGPGWLLTRRLVCRVAFLAQKAVADTVTHALSTLETSCNCHSNEMNAIIVLGWGYVELHFWLLLLGFRSSSWLLLSSA